MKALVLGSTGKTGFQVVKQLLQHDLQVQAIARSDEKFKNIHDENLELIVRSIYDIDTVNMTGLLTDVDLIVSCLGHNLTLKGIFGKPHYLVTESVAKAVEHAPKERRVQFILMSTTACLPADSGEKFSFGEKLVMSFMRRILPPQRDNERALKYLERECTGNNNIEWVAVRPDTLTIDDKVSAYRVFDSLQRSPVFNAGQTSRINVAAFMAELATDETAWNTWKFKAPVIYNA